MAKYILITVIAFLALQGCMAKPKGKQPEKSTIEELAANAQTVVDDVSKNLGIKIKEIPDSKKIVEILNNNTQVLATRVQEVVDKLKGEFKAHEGELNTLIKSVEDKLSETATTLQQAAGPEATGKAKELKTSLDNGLKSTVAQIEKLLKAVEPDATKAKTDIQNAAKTILDQVVEIGQNVQQQVKTTVEEHEKTHKH